MQENPFFPRGLRIILIVFVSMLLAIFAMVLSVNYQYPENLACGGMLGAGFPALYICDNWGGGSPTSSWGKITLIDVFNGGINFGGFVVDFLFYTVLFFMVILIMRAIYHRLIPARMSL